MDQTLIKISDLIKKSWDLYIKNFQKFIVPIGVMLIPIILIQLTGLLGDPAKNITLLIVIFVLAAAAIFVDLWAGIALIQIINNTYTNKPFELKAIFNTAFKKVPAYFAVGILSGIIIVLGFILLIIPGIIFSIWYSYAGYINILEEKKGMDALKASKDLVKGRWWATLWRLLVPALLVYIIAMLISAALGFLISGGNLSLTTTGNSTIVDIISNLIILVLTPLFSAFSVILYHSLKETKQLKTETNQPTPTV
jgi:hypothetical protein